MDNGQERRSRSWLMGTHQARSIDEIVAAVIWQNRSFQPDMEITILRRLENTGAWKPDAQLGDVVAVALCILRPYREVDPSDPEIILELLKDFEIIWIESISPLFEGRAGLLGLFQDGGDLDKGLLGEGLYSILGEIRRQLSNARIDRS